MRLLIIGMNPIEKVAEPLHTSGQSGARLAKLSDMQPEQFLRMSDRANAWPMPASVVDAFPPTVRKLWDEYGVANLRSMVRGRRVVLLGRDVAKAVTGEDDHPFFEWRMCPRVECVYAVSPHPSGRSRWWNDPENLKTAARFWRTAYRPCIHVEGPDGAGKTYLSNELSEHLRIRMVPSTGKPAGPGSCLQMVQDRVAAGLVSDRSSGLVSELVYGTVLRGCTIVPEEELWSWMRSVVGAVRFVYCTRLVRDPEFRDEEELEFRKSVVANMDRIAARYREVMGRIAMMGGRVTLYDPTVQSHREVVLCAGS